MWDTQLVMYDEDYRKILAVIQRLVRDANAKGIFVVDKNGQLIAEAGEVRGIDTTSLASLTAGSIAATRPAIAPAGTQGTTRSASCTAADKCPGASSAHPCTWPGARASDPGRTRL